MTSKMEEDSNSNTSFDSPRLKRPDTLFTGRKLICDENVNFSVESSDSSPDDEASPTNNMNQTRKMMDKPTLVKRLAFSLLRASEECRPLVVNKSSPSSPAKYLVGHGKTNEMYDLERYLERKFGTSCRQSLNSVKIDPVDRRPELSFRRHLIRETNSATSSPKRLFASIKRTDSDRVIAFTEDDDLQMAPWYHKDSLPREASVDVLQQQSPGAFLVRRSTSKPGCFVLSLRVPASSSKIQNYLILRTSRGYKIKGFTKEFSTLRALITHHSVMPEMLPVPLALPRPKNILTKSRKSDDYDTYNDLKKIISELNISS